jgi:hypothetical protein
LDHTSVNRAIASLDVSNNSFGAEGTKLLAEALTSNQIMTELNVSSNYMMHWDMTGVTALADADMGAISTFTFSSDIKNSEPITMETSMVEADFGGKYLGTSGAIMVAAFLPKCT